MRATRNRLSDLSREPSRMAITATQWCRGKFQRAIGSAQSARPSRLPLTHRRSIRIRTTAWDRHSSDDPTPRTTPSALTQVLASFGLLLLLAPRPAVELAAAGQCDLLQRGISTAGLQ